VALFVFYCALVMGLAVFEPSLREGPSGRVNFDPVLFWLGFVVVAAFIFGVLYFFVVQRDKAHRLLAEEKAKSEGLLRRIEADLAQAARIQKDLLPKASPDLAGYDISGVNVPCYEVGGDYYDFVPIDPDRIGVVVADVSGKGISASLLMASLRAALLAEVRPDYDLGRMAARLSDFVYKSSGPASFVTFFFVELDRRTTLVRYVNAGHNPPFVLDRDGHARPLEISGFPLGMFAGSVYEARTSPLAPGELAVLFTDGIPEGRNDRGQDYSDDRFMAFVRERRALPAAEICREVISDVHGFSSGTEPCDDITLVVLKRTDA
jgi:sigma-B regulation protein RsbU (phosphoserine phosphatase)